MSSTRDRILVEIAEREGTIPRDRLEAALAAQLEMQGFGISKPVGTILIEKEMAPRDVVLQIAARVGEHVVKCPHCGEPNDPGNCDRHGRLCCARCEESVEFPDGRISEEHIFIPSGVRPGRKPEKRARKAKSPPPQPHAPSSQGPSGPRGNAAGEGGGESSPRAPRRHQAQEIASEKTLRASIGSASALEIPAITRFQLLEELPPGLLGRSFRIAPAEAFGAVRILDPAFTADRERFQEWTRFLERVQDLPRTAAQRGLRLFKEASVNYVARPWLDPPDATIGAVLSGTRAFSPAEASEFAAALLESLAVFHAARLVHGNLKPENVHFSSGSVVLLDPGAPLLLGGLPAEERVLRLWDRRDFVAPEIFQGKESTPASDVFAAGRLIEAVRRRALESGGVRVADAGVLSKLEAIERRMTALDPVERPSTAKEALKEFRGVDVPRPGPRGAAREGPSRARKPRTGLGSGKSRWLSLAGPATLLVALAALGFAAVEWFEAKNTLASPARSEESSNRWIEERVSELERATPELAASEGTERWRRLRELLRGTSWESSVAERSRLALESRAEPERRERQALLRQVDTQIAAGNWVAALEALIRVGERPDLPSEERERWNRVRSGLHESLGMVYIPAGSRAGQAACGPFLVDAALARADESKRIPANAAPPLTGIPLEAARRLARVRSKRLLGAREWDRIATLDRGAGESEADAATRILEIPSPWFEWVESDAPDSLSAVGYGTCRGGEPRRSPAHDAHASPSGRRAQGCGSALRA